jgi:hypothetical protein
MNDEERFVQVATGFKNKLRGYGLRPTKLRKDNEAAQNGWWTAIAPWRKDRPMIGLWLDHALSDDNRLFWFGFYSPSRPTMIDDLVEELRFKFSTIPVVDGIDFEHQGFVERKRREVRQNSGFAYERYHEDDDDFQRYFGEYEVGFAAQSDNELVDRAAAFISDVIEYVDPSFAADRDVKALDKKSTDYEALVLARRGQGRFRAAVERIWRGRCAVSGCIVPEVLRASHIQPWRASNDWERLDGNNGLLLNATLDALFDKAFISFDQDGKIMISPRLSAGDENVLTLRGMSLSSKPTKEQNYYLEAHRKEFRRLSEPKV